MTLRRLDVLLRYLPADAPIWRELQAEAADDTADEMVGRLRARHAHYAALAAAQAAATSPGHRGDPARSQP